MNITSIATAIAIREMGCEKIDTIEDRILLQKKVYIAQELGLPLGYGYSWYIHGPYSPDLTTAIYQIVPEGFESISEHNFKPQYADIISKVNLLDSYRNSLGLKLTTVQWYELLASLLYWSKENPNKRYIVDKLKESKPQFSLEEVNSAYYIYEKFHNEQKL